MKKLHWSFPFLRRAHSFEYLVNFYVASIVSLLFMRFTLIFLHYPIVGRGIVHFSHTLTGGFLLFIALLLQMLFVDKRMMRFSSVLGGLGFGFFIDEVGKFITKDNNYFFRPAVLIIYFFYLFLFFLLYKIRYSSLLTREEKAANMIVEPSLETTSFLWKLQRNVRNKYKKIAKLSMFQLMVQYALFTYAIVVFVNLARIVLITRSYHVNVSTIGQIVSNIAAALCIFIGVGYVKRSRIQAYKWYQRAILIWIFFTQFFVFYEDQFSAVIYLGASLLLLTGIRYMLDEEKTVKTVKGHAPFSN